MQKKIIALAIAAVASSAAFAQSNVQIYGVADVFVSHSSASGNEGQTTVDSGGLSGSRIGFKGTEDLGNGLKAMFNMEYGLAMTSNTGIGAADTPWSSSAARQQYVGLSSQQFGTVVAGRLQTAGYDFSCSTNPLGGSAFSAVDKLSNKGLLTCGSNGRADNAVAYIAPTFKGITLAYNHARVTEDANRTGGAAPATYGTGKDSYANLISANYKAGPVDVTAVFSKIGASQTQESDNVTEYGLGGSYDFGVAKAFASFQTYKNSAWDSTDKKYQLGVAVPVSANGTVKASYAHTSLKHTAGSDNANAYSVAYVHGLSKRTNLYGGYTYVDNQDLSGTGVVVNTPVNGGHASILGVGINHSF